MLLTWLLPLSPFALSSVDLGPRLQPHDDGSRIRDRNGGSSMTDSVSCWLIVIIMADPLSCWHLIVVVDHDRGGSWWWILSRQWLWTIVASDLDGGSWSWGQLNIDYDYSRTIYPYLADVLLYTWHLFHFCPSWERDPSHVALSEVSTFFLPC